jgi:hypothetical protein
MGRIVVGLSNLTQPLLLYPGLGPAMLEQHRQSKSVLHKFYYLFIIMHNARDALTLALVYSEKNSHTSMEKKILSSGLDMCIIRDTLLEIQRGVVRCPNYRRGVKGRSGGETSMNRHGFLEWFGPSERKTLYPL